MLVHRLGYDGIELGQEWLNQPVEAIREQLAGIDLAVSAIVGSIQLLDTDPQKRAEGVELDRRRLQMAKDLGADCVIEVPVFGANKFQDISPVMTAREVEEKLLIAGLRQLTGRGTCERTGITLLLEPCNHKETHFMNRASPGQRRSSRLWARRGSERSAIFITCKLRRRILARRWAFMASTPHMYISPTARREPSRGRCPSTIARVLER